MRQIKKIGMFFVLAIVGLVLSAFALEEVTKGNGGFGGLSSAVEALKIKSLKPGMPPAEVKRQSELAPMGAMGLLKSLTTSESLTMNHPGIAARPTQPVKETETYIAVKHNSAAILERQTDLETASPENVKGVVESQKVESLQGQIVEVSQTQDGRDVIAVINDPSVQDHSDIDRIMAMNIPAELRAKILKNYELTGTLPEILVKEKAKRKPSSSLDDDPYNKQNW
ncbi:MAG: hypothetical protein J0L82_17530 [Deltaproteobacteria bacterium]|jgi:hypothetical protein|nr:hypothetical protein [Deltaproteobacteria bacterium]